MFGNLIESTSHKGDNARKSWFFLGTFAVYAVVFLAIGVGGIYAYNTHVEAQSLELVSLITPVEMSQVQTPPRSAAPRSADNNAGPRPMSVRTAFVAPTTDPTRAPHGVSTTPETVPPVTPGLPVTRGGVNMDVGGGGTGKPGAGNGFGDRYSTVATNTGGGGELVTDTPPPVMERKPVKPPLTRNMGVVNGMASYLPKPTYTAIAKAARASGTVTVQVLIDEHGKVISAHALNGNPLLLRESVQAAYQARFTPTLLSNQPVKVSGVITYNFVMQ